MTLSIVIATAVVSYLAFQNRELKAKLLFNPYLVKHSNQWYRAVTHAFIHADWMHFGVNMYVLYMFGGITEYYLSLNRAVGSEILFLSLYFGGILFATLSSFKRHQDNFQYNSLGASGAVSAVLYASIYFDPLRPLGLLFIPFFEFPAVAFGVFYLVWEWYMDKKSNDNVAHDAHFWGAAFGFVYAAILVPSQFSNFIDEIISRFTG